MLQNLKDIAKECVITSGTAVVVGALYAAAWLVVRELALLPMGYVGADKATFVRAWVIAWFIWCWLLARRRTLKLDMTVNVQV